LGRSPSAICLETRPRFQGRITAKELSEHGIPTTMVVDSAVESVIREATMALVGADSVLSTGDLINKIGTATVAQVAYDAEVPFLCCAELYKFDPLTLFGRVTQIEQRDPKEVADPKEFSKVAIRNPAFDRTPAKHISAYVTEKGVVSPQSLLAIAMGEFSLE
jgi:ribose 1,5-bisphosphate isomerase